MFDKLKLAFSNAPKKYLFQQQQFNALLLTSNIAYLFFLYTYFPPVPTLVAVGMGMVIGILLFVTVGNFITDLFNFWCVLAGHLLDKAKEKQTNHLYLSAQEEDMIVQKAQEEYILTTRPGKAQQRFETFIMGTVVINALIGLGIVFSIHAR